MPNFLEQLVAEWYEFRGYFVRRNVNVGKRLKGGFESELDVIAFHPEQRRLVHIEPSMDCYSWEQREKRFSAKFAAGQKYIPSLFQGFTTLPKIEPIALFVYAAEEGREFVGGGKVQHIKEFMKEIRSAVADMPVRNKAIPEQYVILRGLQFAINFWE
jgi:hypothetical protein